MAVIKIPTDFLTIFHLQRQIFFRQNQKETMANKNIVVRKVKLT